jgi:hypothetical protein
MVPFRNQLVWDQNALELLNGNWLSKVETFVCLAFQFWEGKRGCKKQATLVEFSCTLAIRSSSTVSLS